ncbi:class I SAM-dependent methyltransferase [Bradyrhizobium sp. 83012]|uniref:Class I SAM-dependent methyltransferase n=1 Tax=Bradyrhizobium aeschynomenes TaxID=2734909 RepID=A0ABX2CMN3_9BRAD|nr:class I SAM-dependent methyltransferase [Bradyrhizobium aeschynomenes]NPU14427.1 class I SAM-dependent methyltransferase [Bradyrhizobium aeschynomenes]NPU69431.1 class I SAM-dependent methyltransferase [Bradyrhizobium aeschynomenes]
MTADITDGARQFIRAFSDPEFVARYTDGPRRFVPGLDGLHRMTAILLAERAPKHAKVLVLGAGGGLELSALADAHPSWTFVGVDPSPQMLQLAERTLGARMSRVDLIEGTIDDAPAGPFDAATCLLTLHFLPAPERLRTVRAVHDRLRPGASFVVAHGCLPREPSERALWLDRYAAYAVASGVAAEQAISMRATIEASTNMLSPDEDGAVLRDGGFRDSRPFFSALTWHGWVGHAGSENLA